MLVLYAWCLADLLILRTFLLLVGFTFFVIDFFAGGGGFSCVFKVAFGFSVGFGYFVGFCWFCLRD